LVSTLAISAIAIGCAGRTPSEVQEEGQLVRSGTISMSLDAIEAKFLNQRSNCKKTIEINNDTNRFAFFRVLNEPTARFLVANIDRVTGEWLTHQVVEFRSTDTTITYFEYYTIGGFLGSTRGVTRVLNWLESPSQCPEDFD
jgi:hypothetical protein